MSLNLNGPIDRIFDLLGDVPDEVRLLKVAEEYGEASAALIGVRGLNVRKGVTHTTDDLKKELCDIAITALVALRSYTLQPEDELDDRLDEITVRLIAHRAGKEAAHGARA